MRLVVNTFLTLDGVMQAPGGPDEDRDGGFALGGWSFPFSDDQMGSTVTSSIAGASAFLLGRRTYDIFAAFWPKVSGEHEDAAVAGPLNSLPKYVASTTLETADWQNTTVLRGDVPAEIRRIKDEGDGELNVQGSSNLLQTLQQHRLVDEYRLWICPVVVGSGKRLFEAGTAPAGMTLVESQTNSRGALYAVYRTAGAPETGSFAPPDQE
jgi:dihydrofolate reductase